MPHYYLSIDIGGTFIKYAEVNHSGEISQVSKIKTPSSLLELESILIEIVEPHHEKVSGIGICCPGRVDIHSGTVYNGGALTYLDGFSVKTFLKEKFSVEVAVSNDGKAAALCEVWLGNLKNIENGAAIVLGTGVGGGIILNNELLQGSNFQAGEFSYIFRTPSQIDMDNMIGFTGSAVSFIKKCATVLGLDDSDGVGVFQIIREQSNREVNELFNQYCQEIAYLILNLQATLDIEKVIIGGVISSQTVLIKGIKKHYIDSKREFKFWDDSWRDIIIDPCQYGSNANLLGTVYQLLIQIDNQT